MKNLRGLFLFKRNEKSNGKGTLTPKMPFAARFSCCAMVVLTSPVKCHKSKKGQKFQGRAKSLKVRALLAGVVKLLACKPTVSS